MLELNFPTLVVTGGLAALVGFILYKRRSSDGRWPPEGPRMPFLGTFPYLGPDLPKGMIKLKDELGPIFTIYMGPTRVVVLGTYELIKEVFLKPCSAGRMQPTAMDFLSDKGFIATDEEINPMWTKHRKIAVNALVGFGMGNPAVIEDKVKDEMQYITRAINSHNGAAFNIVPILERATSNVISSMLFGKRFEYEDKEFVELLWVMKQAFTISMDVGLALSLPWLQYLPGDKFRVKELKQIGKQMKAFFERKVDEHRAAYDPDVQNDIIDVYLKEQARLQRGGKGEQLTDVVLEHHIADLFAGGSETIPTVLQWGMVFMVRHPNVQRKLQAEIDDVVGKRGELTMNAMQQMPYTNACVCEMQRFADIVPFSIFRRLLEDLEVAGYTLPKDTPLLPLMCAVHFSPDIWETPQEYNPQHFLNPDGSFRKRDEMIHFSIGKRNCAGEPLARMQLFLYLASILQRFTLTIGAGEKMPDYAHVLGVNRKCAPFKIAAIDRWQDSD